MGCQIKNKQREISSSAKDKYNSYNVEMNIADKYDIWECTYESFDVDALLEHFIGDIDKEKVTEEISDDETYCTYENGDDKYIWIYGSGYFRYRYNFSDDDTGDIKNVDMADSTVRELLNALGYDASLSNPIVVADDTERIALRYDIINNGFSFLNNRVIAYDPKDMDSRSMKRTYVECEIINGILSGLSFENIPKIKTVQKTYDSDSFIDKIHILDIVDKNGWYPSSNYVTKISIRYLPLEENVYYPVYEIFFDESQDRQEEQDNTMLIDVLSGKIYD